MAPGDRPLAPERLCRCLPFSYGDHPNRSSVPSGKGLVGIPGSPGCLPSGSGSSIFSLVPQVLRGRVGLPVPCSLFWPFYSSSGLYPRHGPCLCDHASSWHPDPPVPRRLAGPGFHLPGELTPMQTQDYLGITIQTIPSRVFPTLKRIQKLSYLLQDFLSTRSHPVSVWRQLLGIMSSMSALVPGSRLRMRSLQIRLNVACRLQLDDFLVEWDSDCHQDLLWWSDISRLTVGMPLGESLRDLCLFTTSRTQAGACLSETSISPARGLPSPLGFPSITESFWRFCWLFGVSFLLFGDVWWRCSPTTSPPQRTSRNRVVLVLPLSTRWLSWSSGFARIFTSSLFCSSSKAR